MRIPTLEEYKQLNGYNRNKIRAYMKSQGLTPLHARTGVPGPLKGREMPERRGPMPPRPHIWRVGPDEYRHRMFVAWHKHKAQALYRGEEYLLTFEDFESAWQGQFSQRGRKSSSLVLVRRDIEGAWSRDNVELILRQEQLKRTAGLRKLAHS